MSPCEAGAKLYLGILTGKTPWHIGVMRHWLTLHFIDNAEWPAAIPAPPREPRPTGKGQGHAIASTLAEIRALNKSRLDAARAAAREKSA